MTDPRPDTPKPPLTPAQHAQVLAELRQHVADILAKR